MVHDVRAKPPAQFSKECESSNVSNSVIALRRNNEPSRSRGTALLAPGSPAAVLTDPSAGALLAVVPVSAVLTDRGSPALLALGSPAAVLTD